MALPFNNIFSLVLLLLVATLLLYKQSDLSHTSSVVVRAFDQTIRGASFITQEDQCFDEDRDQTHHTGGGVHARCGQAKEYIVHNMLSAVFTPDNPTT